MLDNWDQKLKNAVHGCVHTLKNTIAFRKADDTSLFRQNLTVSPNLHYYVQKQSTTSESSVD
jgi:hypothetical protein